MKKALCTLVVLTSVLCMTGCISLPAFTKKEAPKQTAEVPVEKEKKLTVQELIRAGRIDEAKKSFLSLTDYNSQDEKGNTVLHAAAEFGDSDLINYFLSKDVDYTLYNKDGDTALHIAINRNKFAAARTLAETKNSLFLQNKKGKTAIDLISEHNSTDLYNALITDTTGSIADANGRTMVHHFVIKQNENAISKCIEKNIPLSVEDKSGKTPLMLCYEDLTNEKSISIASLLIMARCEPVRGVFSYFEDAVRVRNVSLRFDDNQTPLHLASINGHSGIVKYLLSNGAPINVQDNTGSTPLHEAVRNGYADIVKILLDAGANVNARDSLGKTPLLLIIQKNQTEIYNALLLKRADTTAKDLYGDTVLHIATMCRADVTILQRLVDTGADVNERNKNGVTPLSLAIEYKNKSHISFYSKLGADIYAENNENITPLSSAFSSNDLELLKTLITQTNISSRDSKGNTALHLAIKQKVDVSFIRYLLDCGADIDARNSDGESLLYLCVDNDNREIGEILISRGANIYATNNTSFSPLRLALTNGGETRDWVLCSTVIGSEDAQGNSPLHYAAEWKLDDSISYIITKGGDLNKKNANGETALYCAVKADSPSTISLLIKNGANPDTHDLLGNTPLHYAVRWNSIDAAKELIKNGCRIDSKNTSGKTPLSVAARSGKKDMVALLFENGADINTSDITGKTILTDAIQSEFGEMVSLILGFGASVNIQDMYGRNSYHEAVEVGNLEIINLIRKAGGNSLSRDSFGKTPFSLSISKGIDIVKAVLGDEKYITDSDGNNPLHAAVKAHSSVEIIDMLISRKLPIDQRNGQGLTPLELAVKLEQKDLAIALIENKADPFITDNNGDCSVILAFDPKNEDILNAMIDYSGNLTDLQGDSILHYAARGGSVEVVKLLLDKGLDKSKRNTAGERPYDIAKRWKRDDIAKLLL